LGTRAGTAYADGKIARPSGKAGVILAEFISIGDQYRSFQAGTCGCYLTFQIIMALCTDCSDPRTDRVRQGIDWAIGMGNQWETTDTMGEGPPLWP
jgi:hypothetical protein